MKNVMELGLLIVVIMFTSCVDCFHHCPHKCTCNHTAVECTDKELEDIPDFERITIHPDTVDLSINDIEEVKSYHFFYEQFDSLQFLQLDDNDIFKIHAEAFVPLPNLQYLDLSNNQLTYIPSEFIQKNTKLKELNLQGNLFGLQTPKIISDSLLILDISSSKISELTKDHLKGIPNLKALYLHVNNIHHLEYNIFSDIKLKYLDLAYNPWKCNCNTIKLFDHLLEAKMVKIETPVQCMHRNKFFEDIYDANGPMHHNRLCKREQKYDYHLNDAANLEKEITPELNVRKIDKTTEVNNVVKELEVTETIKNVVVHNNKRQIEEEEDFRSVMNLEIFIIVGIITVLIVLSLISLAVVFRRRKLKHCSYAQVRSVVPQKQSL